MTLQAVEAFFDRLAPTWDAYQDLREETVERILDAAGVEAETTVLDVGCGTGVLFPYYLARNVRQVIGVDLSKQMIRVAAEKNTDNRIKLICADAQTLRANTVCDAVVLFNCFPHFPDPDTLFEALSHWLLPGGRITVAHSMSLERLNAHHFSSAEAVSRCGVTEDQIRSQMGRLFRIDRFCSEADCFFLSGCKI